MKVVVYGLWHLGCVTAGCLARTGSTVFAYSSDKNLILNLQCGLAPLHEPGLNDLLSEEINSGRLFFTNDEHEALNGAEILWVCFDTEVDENDIADVDFVVNSVLNILPSLDDNVLVIVSSQIPVGSIQFLKQRYKQLSECNAKFPKGITFSYIPENLRLGRAIDSFLKPERIVVGIESELQKEKLVNLLSDITQNIIWMRNSSAEMVKHSINAFLAMSISFANEIATLCELVGADAKQVEAGLKSEGRIGTKAYLSPGSGFAGGTLARDVNFLHSLSDVKNINSYLIKSINASNKDHKGWVFRRLESIITDFSDLRVCLLGLSYKSGTDTLRRSAMVDLCYWLVEKGATVSLHDPIIKSLPNIFIESSNIEFYSELSKSIDRCDLIVLGDNNYYKNFVDELLEKLSNGVIVVDPANILSETSFSGEFNYYGFGVSDGAE